MTDAGNQIEEIRRTWGRRLIILGHHYQRPAVLTHADEMGDSLELSRKAAAFPDAERIVFCGVRFMAETADILSGAAQTVYMPDMLAGCPMANMAALPQVEAAWRDVTARAGSDWLPVVYVNSTAEIKAFCGRNGGSTCTSSNAAKVFRWAFAQGRRILFLPDEHLGANTARDLGIPDDEVAVYDPRLEGGGVGDAALRRARVVVWKGFCIVHVAFTVEQIRALRATHPDARIIVHPETPKEVVALADAHGSTSQIIRYVEDAPDGSTIVIGTEMNLVQRLAETYRGRKTILALRPSVCANMAKTNEQNLLALLERWPASHEVHVPALVAAEARRSLECMLAL
jgi:quinolinate synthase